MHPASLPRAIHDSDSVAYFTGAALTSDRIYKIHRMFLKIPSILGPDLIALGMVYKCLAPERKYILQTDLIRRARAGLFILSDGFSVSRRARRVTEF